MVEPESNRTNESTPIMRGEELSILDEIATSISSGDSVDKILNEIIQKCVKHLGVEQGAMMLLEKEGGNSVFKSVIRKIDSSSELDPYYLNEQLNGWMIINKQTLLVNDIFADERFKLDESESIKYNSILSVPLCVGGNMIGCINLFNKKHGKEFVEEDARLLRVIAANSAQLIDHARLIDKDREFYSDVETASRVQKRLFPGEHPEIEGYEIAGRNIPAKEVSGDYYDIIQIEPSKVCFCLADVSGKGLPAAIVMSNLHAAIRGQVMHDYAPEQCVLRANYLLCKSTETGYFATLIYGVLNTENNRFWYCNAGHMSPYLIKQDGSIEQFKDGGLILGMNEDSKYRAGNIDLDTGDFIVIYSDGITEAMNEEDIMFEEPNLQRVLKENRRASAEDILDAVFAAVNDHAGKARQSDDMTLLVIKRSS